MSTKPADTDQEAWTFRRGILENMDHDGRVMTAIELSEAVREIQLSGVMARNPTWSRAEAVRHLVLKHSGIDLGAMR